jgi:Flp pilus assembly protein TadG
MSVMRLRSRSCDDGQALVEFAFVAPIFFLILFGIIQLGLIFGGQNYLVNTVREVARYAAPYRVIDDAGATTTCSTVASSLTTLLRSSGLTADPSSNRTFPTVTYKWNPEPGTSPTTYYVTVTVRAEYKFPLYVPIVGNFIDNMDGVHDNNIRLSAQEEMRVENDPLASTDGTVSCS